jgi:hypothetical protein
MIGAHRWPDCAPAVALELRPATVTLHPTATLRAHLLVTAAVDVTCDPLEVPVERSSLSAEIEQSVVHNTAIATASYGNMTIPGSPSLIVCDGTAHTISIPMVARPPGPPFKRGNAVMRVFAGVCSDTAQICVSGGTDWQVVRLVHG